MITGSVNSSLEAVIQVNVGPEIGSGERVGAVIDTGYSGFLTLPPTIVRRLSLVFNRTGRATLADGKDVFFNNYQATVSWDGHWIDILVDEVDAIPLVGTSLLRGCEFNMQVIEDGAVSIHRLTSQ